MNDNNHNEWKKIFSKAFGMSQEDIIKFYTNLTIQEIIKNHGMYDINNICQYSKYINEIFDNNHEICKQISNYCIEYNYHVSNDNFSINTVLKYPNKKWNYYHLSFHVNFSWEIICDHMELPWDHNMLSCNPNINIDIMMDNPMIQWDYSMYSNNINIDWEQIMDYAWLKHSFRCLLSNEFYRHINYRRVNLRRELFDIDIILECRVIVNELL
jgi:hypothetical protein